MALPFNTLDSFIRTNVMPVLVDNIFKSNIVMLRFFKNAAKWRGGTKIEAEIEYGKNTNAESYSGSTVLTANEVEIATKASLPPRQYNNAIVITGIEWEENKGDDPKIIDIVKAKMKNAEKSLKDLFGTHFFATQTGTNLDGVGGVFAATGGTAYAGINPTDFAGWKSNGGNGPKDVSGNLTRTIFDTEWNNCKVDTDKPTLIVTTDALWAGISNTYIEANKRYEDKKLANIGFENITWHGTPMVTDSHNPSESIYLFNEKYLKVHVMPGMNFKWIPWQYPTTQDIKIGHIRWYGNLLCTNLARQGQLINVSGVA